MIARHALLLWWIHGLLTGLAAGAAGVLWHLRLI
jgi:hypothetical protein